MNKAVYLAALVIILVLLVAGSGCSASTAVTSSSPTTSQSPTPAAGAAIEVTDQLGRTVKLEKIPERIISLAPSNTEILFALGLADKVVGVTSYDNYPPEATKKAIIGGFSTPNIEKLAAQSPDLIVAAPIHEKEVIPQLEKQGFKVLGLNPKDVNGVSAAITLTGRVTGKAAEAGVLVNQLNQRLKSISEATSKLSGENKPRVFYVVWHDPLMTAGSDTMIDDLINRSGGSNIGSDLSGYANITLETVIQRNPQIILVINSMGDQDTSFSYIKSEPRFQSTDALKNNKVYQLDADIFGRSTPRIVDGLEQMAKIIHPEIFK